MKLTLLGAPGAGKGTQAAELEKEYNIPAISTGQIIREAIAAKTALGNEVKTYIDRGELVPDDIVVEMVKERVKDDDCKFGYILDGFPRTISQAETMEKLLILVDCALEIDVDEDIIVDRLSGRRVCSSCGATYHITGNPSKKEGVCDKCGSTLKVRDDDVPDVIRHRLKVYSEQTKPLKDFYDARGKLITVKGQDKVEDTTRAIMKALKDIEA
ncbi:MAG: adenylate kinase [Clostridia bacterium]|nr:adenylate kinase [Clostridia bacterium]